MPTLHRTTSGGLPVRIEIDGWKIAAYREQPAQVLTHEFGPEGERVSVEPTLSRYFSEEAVLTITKCWSRGDFVVDFEAGFSRGRITVGQHELTTRCAWPNPAPGYLKWIGLSWKDPEVRAWLRDPSVMDAALAKLQKEAP